MIVPYCGGKFRPNWPEFFIDAYVFSSMARARIHPIKTIAAVERALLVLEAFRGGAPSLSLSEVVAATGLLKTTVFRILLTFEQTGYLIRLPNGRFQLGAIFMELGMICKQSFRLEDHVNPVLERLVQATDESASFYIREGEQRLCLLRVESQQPVRDVASAGTLMPIDDTAASMVLRTYHECQDPRALLNQSATSMAEMTFATIGKGTTPQVASVAAPIFGAEGLLGAVSVSGPCERFPEDVISTIRGHVGAEAEALSRKFLAMPAPKEPE